MLSHLNFSAVYYNSSSTQTNTCIMQWGYRRWITLVSGNLGRHCRCENTQWSRRRTRSFLDRQGRGEGHSGGRQEHTQGLRRQYIECIIWETMFSYHWNVRWQVRLERQQTIEGWGGGQTMAHGSCLAYCLFLCNLWIHNGFCISKWLEKMKRRIFCNIWKWHKF